MRSRLGSEVAAWDSEAIAWSCFGQAAARRAEETVEHALGMRCRSFEASRSARLAAEMRHRTRTVFGAWRRGVLETQSESADADVAVFASTHLAKLLAEDEPEEAQGWAERGLALAETVGPELSFLRGHAARQMGRVLLARGQLAEAEGFLERAADSFRDGTSGSEASVRDSMTFSEASVRRELASVRARLARTLPELGCIGHVAHVLYCAQQVVSGLC